MQVFATRRWQAEEIAPLADENDHADAGGEPGDDRVGYESNDAAELGESERQQDQARHERRDLQAIDPVLCRDTRQDHDEGAGGTGNLHLAAAKE